VVNVETKDTHEEATNGALAALDLMERVRTTWLCIFISLIFYVCMLFCAVKFSLMSPFSPIILLRYPELMLLFDCLSLCFFSTVQINARYDEWQDEIQSLLDEVEQKSGLSLLHAVLYY
jgi:hypothetical protein